MMSKPCEKFHLKVLVTDINIARLRLFPLQSMLDCNNWPLTNSDFPTDQTFHQFHDLYTELDLHRIMSGFHGAFATDVASQQGTLTPSGTPGSVPPFLDLLVLLLLRPDSSNLPCLYSTFHLEYPLVLSRFCFKRLLKTIPKWCMVTTHSFHLYLNHIKG